MDNNLTAFIAHLADSVRNKSFIKLSLGNYKGVEPGLKQLYIKPILVKKQELLSFNYRNQTNDIFKNYGIDDALITISDYIENGFQIATLFTVETELIYERLKNGKTTIRNKLVKNDRPSLVHDKEKSRLITEDRPYLEQLGLAGKDGKVFKNAQDKFKQINHYLELLSPLLKDLASGRNFKVADMGSGKGYLTFALYDYLTNRLGVNAEICGVEFRKDLVDYCNNTVAQNQFGGLSFVEGTIEDYDANGTDMLIALHACDTATDDAIAKGIKAGSELIIVAPCCHKQIRKAMEKSNLKNELSFITKHGIFLERQAEMITDAIRSMILEYHGYKTKVMQFISDVHTPKNVMIVAVKNREQALKNKNEVLDKIQQAKAFFGIDQHYLEQAISQKSS